MNNRVCRGFLCVVIFLILSVSCASATVSIYSDRIQVINEPRITPSEINSNLSDWLDSHTGYENLSYYMEEVEPNVWLFRKCLHFYNSTGEFNGSLDCSELRLGKTQLNPGGLPDFGTADTLSSLSFKDVVVRGWDETTGVEPIVSADKTKITANNIQTDNVSFKSVLIIAINSMPLDSTIENVNINDSIDGFITTGLQNVTFSNINGYNISAHLISLDGENCEVSDVTFINDPSFRLTHSTSSNGLSIGADSSNIYAHDMYFDSPKWGGVYTSGTPHDILLKNITVLYAGHNAIDIHAGYNITVQNITANCSYSNNYIVSGPYGDMMGLDYGVYNITFDTIRSYFPSGRHMVIDTRVSHVTLKNVSMTPNSPASREGLVFFICDNITGFKISTDNMVSSCWYPTSLNGQGTQNTRLFDSYITGSSYRDIWFEALAENAKIINCLYTKFSASTSDYGRGYYLDVLFEDATGTPIPDVEYTVTFNDSSYSSTDATAYCENQSVFISDSSGRSYQPSENRDETPVIYSLFTDVSGTYPLFTNVTSDYATLDNIIPDTKWYRSDVSQSKYTITAINNSSDGLHFTGFAPSPKYNNFSEVGTVKFQIWANEELDYVSWKKDGVEVQNSSSTTYTTTLSDAPITVDISGSCEIGTISKTWVLDPQQVVDPGQNGTAPTAAFSASATSGTYPFSVSFTDESTGSPTNWYWDFDNDSVIDSTEQNPSEVFRIKGNYTIKLTISNTNGTDHEQKSQYIQVTGPNVTKKPTLFGYFRNTFYRIFGV